MHAISTIRCPSLGSKPVVSVSKTISRISEVRRQGSEVRRCIAWSPESHQWALTLLQKAPFPTRDEGRTPVDLQPRTASTPERFPISQVDSFMAHPHTPNPNNRLSGEPSPSLRQHKDNPVDWRAWGEAALAEAKKSNRPILLSVGYAA